MNPLTVTKKSISGYGSYYQYRESTTKKILYVKCTEGEYLNLSKEGGYSLPPKLNGYDWIGAIGGAPEVEGRFIRENEYIQMPSTYLVARINDKNVAVKEELVNGQVVVTPK